MKKQHKWIAKAILDTKKNTISILNEDSTDLGIYMKLVEKFYKVDDGRFQLIDVEIKKI